MTELSSASATAAANNTKPVDLRTGFTEPTARQPRPATATVRLDSGGSRCAAPT